MKFLLPTAAILLAVLNGLLLIPAMSAYLFPIAALAFALAVAVIVLSLLNPQRQATASARTPIAAQPPPAPANQAEAEIVTFLSLLQEKGRLVDFLMEELTTYDDRQVGAAARVVHQGCRQVLIDNFKISPISQAEEGSKVTISAGYAADEYRLVGKISGDPPFTGVLVHKGWKTELVKLPRILKLDEKRLPSIAPAQVELK
jgi:hypothetical protein